MRVMLNGATSCPKGKHLYQNVRDPSVTTNAPPRDIQKWFMGQVARATKGKADPNVTKEMMLRGLEEKRK